MGNRNDVREERIFDENELENNDRVNCSNQERNQNCHCRRRHDRFEDALEAAYREGYKKGFQDGYEKGYCEGYQQGIKDGYEKARQEVICYVKRNSCCCKCC